MATKFSLILLKTTELSHLCHLVPAGTLKLVFQEKRVGTFPELSIITVWNGSKAQHETDKQHSWGEINHSQPLRGPTDHVLQIHTHTNKLV